jgi:hypothetical protein
VTSIYRLIVGVGVTLLVALSATPAVASVHVWTDAVNTLWSNAGNWTGGVPATGEPGGTTVQFGSGTSSTMDIPGLTVDQIHFTGSGNTITGSTALNVNGSTLVTNILDGSGGNTLALPVALPGGTAVLADVTAGQLCLGILAILHTRTWFRRLAARFVIADGVKLACLPGPTGST